MEKKDRQKRTERKKIIKEKKKIEKIIEKKERKREDALGGDELNKQPSACPFDHIFQAFLWKHILPLLREKKKRAYCLNKTWRAHSGSQERRITPTFSSHDYFQVSPYFKEKNIFLRVFVC